MEAHKGSWQNPTNWYYDPDTKKFFDFGDGDIIPCEIIKLSDPIVEIITTNSDNNETAECSLDKENGEFTKDRVSPGKIENNLPNENQNKQPDETDNLLTPNEIYTTKAKSRLSGIKTGIRKVGRFIIDHPGETIEFIGIVTGIVKTSSSIYRKNNSNKTNKLISSTNSAISTNANISDKIDDIVEKTNKSGIISDIVKKAYTPNDVPPHGQHFKTKDGYKWIEKKGYHRGD